MTFHRDENGKYVESRQVTVKSLATTAIDATIEFAEANAQLVHALLNIAVKLGLLIFLWPTIKEFAIMLYKALEASML